MRLPSLIGRIRRSLLGAALLLTAAATPALAAYYPSGPQTFVERSQLDGWQPCYYQPYDSTLGLDVILGLGCTGDPLMLAAGPTGSQTLTVLAAAPRADVLFDTGDNSNPNYNVPHDANGSGWYFNSNWSWGFAKQGDPIERAECDVLTDPNPDQRLCWHTTSGFLSPGYRAGATQGLNDSTDYTRWIFQPVPNLNGFTFTVKGSKLKVGVGTSGAVSVSDAGAPLSASAAKKRVLLLKPSSASGGAPTITVPLRLSKSGKSKLNQNGKVTVRARITFTSKGFGGAKTQKAKLKLTGKTKKK